MSMSETGRGREQMSGNPNAGEFKRMLTTPVEPEKLSELHDFYSGYIEQYRSDLSNRDEHESQITGEYPIETPFDTVPGHVAELPIPVEATAWVRRHIHMDVLSHPVRLAAREDLAERGFRPVPGKVIPVLDRHKEMGESPTFSDLGFGPREPKLGDDPERSANAILATGLFSHVTKDVVASIPSLSSMFDVTSSRSLSTVALVGGTSYLPMDGVYNDPENQMRLYRRSIELLMSDPAIQHREDKDALIQRAIPLIGLTVKSTPADALRRVALFRQTFAGDMGAHDRMLVRVYDPRSLLRLEDTVEALKDEYGDEISIVAGQVVGPEQARRLQAKGASAIRVGIAEGEICSTGEQAALIPRNATVGYDIANAGLDIPFDFEGGVDHEAIAIALGASNCSKSQGIVRGTVEQPPSNFWYKDGENYYKNYRAEASPSAKHLGGKLDLLGDPLYVEGVSGYVQFDPKLPSVASRIYARSQSLATALVFSGHKSLDDLRVDMRPNLWMETANQALNRSPFHQSPKRG